MRLCPFPSLFFPVPVTTFTCMLLSLKAASSREANEIGQGNTGMREAKRRSISYREGSNALESDS